jgi:hypothetical protein
MFYIVYILAVLLAASAFPLVIKMAENRCEHSPLALTTTEEYEVCADVLANPLSFVSYCELEPEDFFNEECSKLWRLFHESAEPSLGKERPKSKKDLPRLEAKLDPHFLDSILSTSSADIMAFIARLKEDFPPTIRTIQDRLKLAAPILNAKLDRDTSNPDLLAPGPEGGPALVRLRPKFTLGYKITAAIFLGAGAFVATASYHTAPNVISGAMFALGVLALTVASIISFFIDLETMNFDYRVFALAYIFGIGSTLVGLLANGNFYRMEWFLASLLIIFFIFIISKALFPGRPSLGLGDLFFIPLSTGIPWAITNSFSLGIWSLILGLLLGVVFGLFKGIRKHYGTQAHYPLLPSLATGWLLGWLIYVVYYLVVK